MASTVVAHSSPRVVQVKLAPGGKPLCVPNEIEARPGDTIEWQGEDHTGRIDGRIPGPKLRGFTEEELEAAKPDAADVPFSPRSWTFAAPRVSVSASARPGAYKYTVTVNGVSLDPVVIIDNRPDDGGQS